MPLVSALAMLPAARAAGYAVGAFSIHTPEMVDAVFAAAERERAPIILQVGRRTVRNSGVDAACAWVRARAAQSPVPACLHLDHAQDLDAIVRGLRAGCSSVMYDGSDLPFEENVRRTAEVVRICHAADVPVEAEVGRVGGIEDDISVDEASARLASPEACLDFVTRSGCDILAPAFGSAHGLGGTTPHLDLERLGAIAAAVPQPLVLHGGSGLDPQQLRGAVAGGVAKVNLDTELRRVFVQALGEALQRYGPQDDPQPALAAAGRALEALVAERMEVLGSRGRAG